MRIVVLFTPVFHHWPLHILEAIQKKAPNLEVIAIAANAKVSADLQKRNNIKFLEVFDLSALENEWIKKPFSRKKFEALEKTVGSKIMLDTVAADKTLGAGWINGADIIDVELSRLAARSEALKSYIFGLFSFLTDLFKTYKPKLTLVYAIAGGPSYALAAVSEHFECPFRRFMHSKIENYYVLDSSKTGLLIPAREILDQSRSKPALLKKKATAAKKWYRKFLETQEKPSFFLTNRKHRLRAQSWPVILRQATAVAYRSCKKLVCHGPEDIREKTEAMHFRNKVIFPLIEKFGGHKKYYQPFVPHAKKPYALFSLHMEPEAATLVMAPRHANQLAVIEAVSKSLPLSMTLLVKEHPGMDGKRPASFYKALGKMPNVVLIDPFESSRNMIAQSALVVTITGTMGWEAILLKRPLVILSDSSYTAVGQGFVRCSDLSRLPEAIQEALMLKPADEKAVIDYIAAVMTAGFHMSDDLLWRFKPEYAALHEKTTQEIATQLYNILKPK